MRSRRRRAGFSSSDLCAHRRDRRTISEVERLLTTPLPSITPTKPSPFRFADTLGMGTRSETILDFRRSSPGRSRKRFANKAQSPNLDCIRSVDSHLPHRCLAAFPAMSLAPVAPFTIHDSRFTFLNHSTFNLFLPRRSHFILFSPIKNGSFCHASGYN
jgi:hypothetical protein